MGVEFDRLIEGLPAGLPLTKLTGFAKPPAGAIRGAQAVAGYYFSHKSTDSFLALNRLLAAGEEVSWLFNGPMGYGTFYVTNKPTTRAAIQKVATDIGYQLREDGDRAHGHDDKLKKLRVGLVDATAAARRPAGPGWLSRTSSSRSKRCSRRCSTQGTCGRSTTC